MSLDAESSAIDFLCRRPLVSGGGGGGGVVGGGVVGGGGVPNVKPPRPVVRSRSGLAQSAAPFTSKKGEPVSTTALNFSPSTW